MTDIKAHLAQAITTLTHKQLSCNCLAKPHRSIEQALATCCLPCLALWHTKQALQYLDYHQEKP